jgi:hypothetical protein
MSLQLWALADLGFAILPMLLALDQVQSCPHLFPPNLLPANQD